MRKKYNRIIGTILLILSVGLLLIGVYLYLNRTLEARHSREGGNPEGKSSDLHLRWDNIIGDTDEVTRSRDNNTLQQRGDEKSVLQEKKAILNFADQTVEFSISDSVTVYDAMNALKAEGKINFEGKEYPVLGFFVTSIGSLKSGGGKNLMYYINGEEATLGISSYVIKEGDIIEWKLK